MRVRLVRIQMPELFVELSVFVVRHLDNAVLDAERVAVVLAERMLGDLDGPAAQILAVEQRVPLARILARHRLRDAATSHQTQHQACDTFHETPRSSPYRIPRTR